MLRGSLASLALAVVATGCIHPQGQARNPAFGEGVAPGPTVITQPIACRDAAPSPNASPDAFQTQFRSLAKAAVPVEQATITRDQQAVLCGALGKDHGNIVSIGPDFDVRHWSAGPTVAAIMQDVARDRRAQSVLVPVANIGTHCEWDDNGGKTCSEGDGALLRAYLFSPDGNIYWKSWAIVPTDHPERAEPAVVALLGRAPAKFDGLPQRPEPERKAFSVSIGIPSGVHIGTHTVAPPPPPPEFDSQGVVSTGMDPQVPQACRAYVRRLCERTSGSPASRAEQCRTFVTSMRPMTSAANAEATCSASLSEIDRTPG